MQVITTFKIIQFAFWKVYNSARTCSKRSFNYHVENFKVEISWRNINPGGPVDLYKVVLTVLMETIQG